MGTFLLVLFIVVLLVAAMSVGVMFGRKPISGSCGGIGALGISSSCEICGGSTEKCEDSRSEDDSPTAANKGLAYDASKPGS